MEERIYKVIAYTQGESVPSARFRVDQLAEFINGEPNLNTIVKISRARYGSYPPSKLSQRPAWLLQSYIERLLASLSSGSYTSALVQREMISTLISGEALIRIPFAFDVDDAIWTSSRLGSIKKIVGRCEVLIAGNAYIADHLSAWAPRIVILPTSVNTAKFTPGPTSQREEVIVWSGSSSGLKYVYGIEKELHVLLETKSSWKLKIISDSPPIFKYIKPNQYLFEKWTPQSEVEGLQSSSIGIMPLADTEWERAKCSYKMLTYMSCCLPVVVSPVGMNRDVLSMGCVGFSAGKSVEWIDALTSLIESNYLREIYGNEGRSVVMKYFDHRRIATELSSIMKDISL
ncbi:glycosyltransferase [Deinococcus sp. YIM 134068]|uniref:glycosyltransferase n=1 Tax=Deinococcus lichenicola TaxID=3118910 RepID=UPI002F91C031